MGTRVALFGGHGKIALLATRMLAERGNHVISVVRSEDQFSAVREYGGHPVLVDVESPEPDLDAVLAEADLVIWSAGAGGGDPARTRAVDLDGARHVIDAAVKHNIRDFLMVSYKGAGARHGVAPDDPFWHYAEAKAQADAALRSSPLDWVIVAPTQLTLATGTGAVGVEVTVPDSRGFDPAVELPASGAPVAREDVASLIAEFVEPMVQGRLHHVTVCVTGGDVPIADVTAQAIRAVRDA